MTAISLRDSLRSLRSRIAAPVRSAARAVGLYTPGPVDPFEVFLTPEALAINEARLNHLASLDLDLRGKSVLEVGAGIGLHTRFFEERGCAVLCTDARPENIVELLRRYPHRQARVMDLDAPGDLSSLGTFDIVYCYGTLYHLRHPEEALAALAAICREMILLETCVTPGDELAVNLVEEDASNPNQAEGGLGCRPTRPWIMATIRKHYGHAYVTATQPKHPDFDLDWVAPCRRQVHRAVLVGAKMPVNNPRLQPELSDRQSHEFNERSRQIWLDVGAHLGEKTFKPACADAHLTVYAFEPNLAIAAKRFGAAQNFVVVPMAVAEYDGFATFYVNSFKAASSLFPFDGAALREWIGGGQLQVEKKLLVPTIRLDTFLARMAIQQVDLLKIDAQGADFSVICSLGDRLKDIRKIVLEVAVTARQLYAGAAPKSVVIDYLEQHGFRLVDVEEQTFGQEENLTFVRGAS